MFESRSTQPEWMDEPDFDHVLAEQSFRFIRVVNRFFGGTRIVRQFIADEAARMPAGKRLNVLDIGSGCCDIPISVAQWARKQGIPVHFTCVEANRHAIEIARRGLSEKTGLPVTVLQEDIFRHRPAEPYDCAVASMFFHHFDEAQILHLIRRLRGVVKESLLINDLLRCFLSYAGCLLLTSGFPGEVKHDALLSIRKGFKETELKEWLSRLEDVSVAVKTVPFFRVKATIRFHARKN